jgi:hypothetical protein
MQQRAKTLSYFLAVSIILVGVFLLAQNVVTNRPLFSFVNAVLVLILVFLVFSLAMLRAGNYALAANAAGALKITESSEEIRTMSDILKARVTTFEVE